MIHENEDQSHAGSARGGRRRELRGEAIVDAALRIVAGEGIEGLTLQRVAREMDYVPAALYRYFPSKDALLAALQRRAVTRLHAAFVAERQRRGPGSGRGGPTVRALGEILAAGRFYLELPATQALEFRLVSLLLGDPRRVVSDDEAAKTAPLLFAFLGDAAALFEEAARCGSLQPGSASSRTLIFWASLQGVSQLEKLRPLAPSLPTAKDLGMGAVEALLLGWGAEPSSLRAAARAMERRS